MLEFWIGFAILCGYFAVCAAVAFLCRKTLKIPDEIFRKILHFILLSSLFVFVFAFKTWWISCIACASIIVLAYPILFFFERFKTYSETVTERKKGELRSSLILVFLMFAIVISVCWGWVGNKYLTMAVIYAWGYGDAFAALVGTKFGKHKIYGKKSWEGTVAMCVIALISVLTVLLIINIVEWYFVLAVGVIVSVAVSATELFTPNGLDTITCPLVSLTVMLPLLLLFGGI
ncbi:MAG: phosphatidate cytidylyltransferase [Clostridia bacterium]|nr:phosphatidate cytidylyltransferase [Clostridia bacterium]